MIKPGKHVTILGLVLALLTCSSHAADQLLERLERFQPELPATPYDYTVYLPAHLDELAGFSTEPDENPITNEGATLGRVLFYDRGLSVNGLVSCASCHSQATGFDDPNRFSIGFRGKITERHSVGLAFAGFNSNGRYFRDEHAPTLEAQVLEPIHDEIEMGLPKSVLVDRIKQRQWYPPLFRSAFGTTEITKDKIARALAQFVRSMVSTGSPYDQARGNANSPTEPFNEFSALENLGKSIFFNPPDAGGSGCTSCHETEAFIMLRRQNNGLDADGVGKPENQLLRGASLRNVSRRAPFMHDGRFKTLRDVIRHYSTDIKNHQQLGEPLKDQDGLPLRFNFSEQQEAALAAFLETLTDDHFLSDPKFSDPFKKRR